jgi:hypothetical protein
LLDGVRRGGALLYALSDPTLNDSLQVQIGPPGYEVRDDSLRSLRAECETPPPFSERVITSFQGGKLFLATLEDSGAPRRRVDTLLRVHVDRAERDSSGVTVAPAAIGFALGRGHVVVVADVDIFRNDNVRVCAWDAAVQVVRLYEYLRGVGAGPARATLLFDEYHQGHGVRPGTARAIVHYLRGTPSGRALAHLGVAGAILLLALGPRSLSPRDPDRVERRSPLEHVEALARAYWHVHATRTGSRTLLHGLRRRTEHRLGGLRRDLADEAFLDWVADRLPQRAADVQRMRRALSDPLPRREFAAVADTIRRLEHDLLTTPS